MLFRSKRLRFLTWNIGGGLEGIELSQEFVRLCRGVDIITFSHTGHAPSGYVPVLEGFDCVVCSSRSYDHTWGGVAVFAKKGLKVSLIQDQQAHGMAWFCIGVSGGRDIYACVCYIPHGSSSYFLHEGGKTVSELSLDAHYDILREGIVKFGAKGEVLIMGDLNARTGQIDDRCDDQDRQIWESMEGMGISVPPTFTNQQGINRLVLKRCSMDKIANSSGERLLGLCKDLGLVILNGRLPGDMVGSCTYFQHGVKNNPSSLIDYFVASPRLVFSASDEVREGSSLWVQSIASNPFRPSGNSRFDHVPLILSVKVAQCGDTDANLRRSKKVDVCTSGDNVRVFKWHMDYRELYVDVLLCDLEVKSCFEDMYEADDIDTIGGNFTRAIETALDKLHNSVGKVVVHANENTRAVNDRPRNTWYDIKCKEARHRFVCMAKQHGPASGQAKGAHQEYRRVTKTAKRLWMEGEAQTMLHNLRANPKDFWAAYGRSGKKGCLNDLKEWTTYFEKLFKSNGVSQNRQIEGDGDSAIMRQRMFPMPGVDAVRGAECLNCDFTVAEIREALHKTSAGKAPGADGLPMDFFKYAFVEVCVDGKADIKHYVLADHITHVFNMVMKKGYPKSWVTGAVVPVPKSKGSLDNMDDYRGITVGCALSKLYSMVMLQRLDNWAEKGGYRAMGQAGFRKGRGTADNAFVLNHMIEKYEAKKSPIYVAFIDFRKAYDCVNRSLLWESLSSIGLHGRFLDSLIAMYDDVRVRVRVDGKLGESFQSDLGVKQGDPLSPLLFGIFIDRLESLLDKLLPDVGLQLKEILLRILLYADDLVLLAESTSDLQKILDILNQFCIHNEMVVNIKKSEVVIFNRQFMKGKTPRLHYNGVDLDVKSMFIYLGILFEDDNGIKKVAERCLSKGRAALYALARRCNELGIHNVYIKSRLFDSLVKPILCYGCEVWGPLVLSKGNGFVDTGYQSDLEQLHKGFLRQCMGLRKSVPDVVIMTEMRRDPLALSILKLSLRFWNNIMGRPDGDIVKLAMVESCELFKTGVKQCWAAHLSTCTQKCEIDVIGLGYSSLDVEDIVQTARAKWLSRVGYWSSTTGHHQVHQGGLSQVRLQSNDERVGFKVMVYSRWFASEESDVKSTFWFSLNRPDQISTVARYRMGCHWLEVENGRISRPFVPRDQRLCRCCNLKAREDELHILYCPLYAGLRYDFGLSVNADRVKEVGEDRVMNELMNNDTDGFWQNMGCFLRRCKVERELRLSEQWRQ